MAENAKTVFDPTGIGTAQNKADVFEFLGKAKKQYDKYAGFINKYRDRYNKAKDISTIILDDYERPGKIAELTFDAAKKVIEKFVGPVSNHPFFKYHSEHFKILFKTISIYGPLENVRESFPKIFKIVKGLKDDTRKTHELYRSNGVIFKKFKDEMNASYVSNWLLLCSITAKNPVRDAVADTWFVHSAQIAKTREVSERAFDELNAVLIALHQGLGAVRAIKGKSDEYLKKMRKEKGMFSFVKILSNLAEQRGKEDVILEQLKDDNIEIDPDDMEKPLLAAIVRTEGVIEDWIAANEDFTDKLFKMELDMAGKNS